MVKPNILVVSILLFAALTLFSCSNQNNKEEDLKYLNDFFPSKKAQVLVVGTFHFDYPGLDEKKTKEKDKIDILTEPKKSELTELIEYIKRFKPNKIAIEAMPNWNADEKLKKYINGDFDNNRDERFQMGMRLVKELELTKIYSIDAESLSDELSRNNNPYLDSIFMSLREPKADGNEQYLKAWDEYSDTLPSSLSLLNFFKHMNNIESHKSNFGRYFLKNFKYENQRGADLLSIWWYNRNLRIFRKIQEVAERDDRLVVIIGNGHAAILRQLLEYSPEYEFIEFESLERIAKNK